MGENYWKPSQTQARTLFRNDQQASKNKTTACFAKKKDFSSSNIFMCQNWFVTLLRFQTASLNGTKAIWETRYYFETERKSTGFHCLFQIGATLPNPLLSLPAVQVIINPIPFNLLLYKPGLIMWRGCFVKLAQSSNGIGSTKKWETINKLFSKF